MARRNRLRELVLPAYADHLERFEADEIALTNFRGRMKGIRVPRLEPDLKLLVTHSLRSEQGRAAMASGLTESAMLGVRSTAGPPAPQRPEDRLRKIYVLLGLEGIDSDRLIQTARNGHWREGSIIHILADPGSSKTVCGQTLNREGNEPDAYPAARGDWNATSHSRCAACEATTDPDNLPQFLAETERFDVFTDAQRDAIASELEAIGDRALAELDPETADAKQLRNVENRLYAQWAKQAARIAAERFERENRQAPADAFCISGRIAIPQSFQPTEAELTEIFESALKGQSILDSLRDQACQLVALRAMGR